MFGHNLGYDPQTGAAAGPASSPSAAGTGSCIIIKRRGAERRAPSAERRAPSAELFLRPRYGRIPTFRTHPAAVTPWTGIVMAARGLPRAGTGAAAPAP